MSTPNTLSPELLAQIEKEALAKYPVPKRVSHAIYNGYDLNEAEYHGYRAGRIEYALKLQQAEENIKQLEQWKKEATLLLEPLLNWGQAQKDIPLGSDVTVEILRRAKMYTQAEEMLGKMVYTLRVLNERMDDLWNTVGTSKPIPENHAAIITKVQRAAYKLLNEYNNYKQTKDGTANG